MDKTVVRLNIEHFREMLSRQLDEPTRQTVFRLLSEEEARFAALERDPKGRKV